MPVVAERIMRGNEVGKVAAETSDGETNSECLFCLLIEWGFFWLFLSECRATQYYDKGKSNNRNSLGKHASKLFITVQNFLVPEIFHLCESGAA